jgi:hypothetical protein
MLIPPEKLADVGLGLMTTVGTGIREWVKRKPRRVGEALLSRFASRRESGHGQR